MEHFPKLLCFFCEMCKIAWWTDLYSSTHQSVNPHICSAELLNRLEPDLEGEFLRSWGFCKFWSHPKMLSHYLAMLFDKIPTTTKPQFKEIRTEIRRLSVIRKNVCYTPKLLQTTTCFFSTNFSIHVHLDLVCESKIKLFIMSLLELTTPFQNETRCG